jgi:hypothetical protein
MEATAKLELNFTATALSFPGSGGAALSSFLQDEIVSIAAKAIHADGITFFMMFEFRIIK